MQLASGSPSPPGGRGPSGSPGESIRGLRRLGSRVQAPGTRPRTSRSADGLFCQSAWLFCQSAPWLAVLSQLFPCHKPHHLSVWLAVRQANEPGSVNTSRKPGRTMPSPVFFKSHSSRLYGGGAWREGDERLPRESRGQAEPCAAGRVRAPHL